MIKIKKFWQLPIIEKWLLIEAAFFLAVAQLAIKLIPFRYFSPYLGKHMALSSETIKQCEKERAILIKQIIHKAANNVPWNSVCLPRAIAAKLMLHRREVESTLFLGVRKPSAVELSAHAWLRVGNIIVTGYSDKSGFKVVSSFS